MTDEPEAAAQSGATATPAASNGPGSAGDFVAPFTNALLAAAKAAATEPAGDPDIIAAFKLGWVMGEILANRHAPPVASILAADPSAVYAAQGLRLNALVTQLKVGESDELTELGQRWSNGRRRRRLRRGSPSCSRRCSVRMCGSRRPTAWRASLTS